MNKELVRRRVVTLFAFTCAVVWLLLFRREYPQAEPDSAKVLRFASLAGAVLSCIYLLATKLPRAGR